MVQRQLRERTSHRSGLRPVARGRLGGRTAPIISYTLHHQRPPCLTAQMLRRQVCKNATKEMHFPLRRSSHLWCCCHPLCIHFGKKYFHCLQNDAQLWRRQMSTTLQARTAGHRHLLICCLQWMQQEECNTLFNEKTSWRLLKSYYKLWHDETQDLSLFIFNNML